MIPADWRAGEVAVVGLAKSGKAASRLLAREGLRVYASDSGTNAAVEKVAAELREAGVSVDVGNHDLERIQAATALVVSPGVPPDAPPIKAARERSVPIISETELGLLAMPDLRSIAVTGTNGKTTTTALVGHLLRAIGLDALDAGNIGTPLTQVALDAPTTWVALELSSFQLHDTPSLKPTVGVVTNLAPDHLDRYASANEYYDDKALIYRNDHAGSRWVWNADDPEVMRLPTRRPPVEGQASRSLLGESWTFSIANDLASAFYDRAANRLVVLDRPVLDRGDLSLLGDHNVANALAAVLAVMVADPAHRSPDAIAAITAGLKSFRALEHRLEPVGEFKGVLWINDSKATNVSSTLVAVQGMTRPPILLLGGRHKGEPYTALAPHIQRVGGQVIAFGESAELVEHDLSALVPVERMGSDFEAVMARARELAKPGDVVLLSPACSSFDMFDNYGHRGAEFRRLARGKTA